MKLKKLLKAGVLAAALLFSAGAAHAQSSFDVLTFKPTNDNSPYFSVYGSQNLAAWQGLMGLYFDFAHKPLQYEGTGVLQGTQPIVKNLLTADFVGALGITDWAQVGFIFPVALHNWYYDDSTFGDEAELDKDFGTDMGDMTINAKFQILNSEKHTIGLALIPYITLPTGNVDRYMGNGKARGGATLVVDFNVHKRFQFAFNVGARLRDDVTVQGVRINDEFTFGFGANYMVAKNFHLIAELYGTTVMNDFFKTANSQMPLEAGGGIKYVVGDSGFSIDVGGTTGIQDGVGAPKFRGFAGLKWASTGKKCPECAPPAPTGVTRTGNLLILPGKIYFDTAKATIKPISYSVLNDIYNYLNNHPNITRVEVQGHADNRGGAAYNLRLSQRRAQSVVNYLVNKGIASSRLYAKGYGFSKPVVPNTSKENQSLNRRVEFHVKSETVKK